MESQKQYRNLHHISFWEIAIANLALWDIPSSLKFWTDLRAEATVRHPICSNQMPISKSVVVESYLYLRNGGLFTRNR